MEKLKEPKQPFPPFEFHYDEKVEKKYIYEFWESLREDDDDGWDDEEEEKRVPEKPISEVNLAWLVSKVPEGVSLDQIKVEFGYNANCMAYEDHYVGFYYEVKIPARKKEFRAAMKKYKEDLAQYEKDLAEYNEACRLQEIKETEERLAKLKAK